VGLIVVGFTVGQVEGLLEALVESFEVGKIVGFVEDLKVGLEEDSSDGLREGCVGARRTPMG